MIVVWPQLDVSLASLALAELPALAIARTLELGDGHCLVELGDGAEYLADQLVKGSRAVALDWRRYITEMRCCRRSPSWRKRAVGGPLAHRVADVCKCAEDYSADEQISPIIG